MNNEMFVIKIVEGLANDFNLNINDKIKLSNSLYRYTSNYEINEIEHEEDSFMDLVSLYNQVKRIEGLSNETLKNRFYTLRELDNYIHKSYDKIAISDLRMYLSHKQEKLNPTSINNLIGQIKPFFSWLYDEGYIDKNPCDKLKRTKQPIRLVKSLNIIDLEKIRMACDNDRDRALVEFAFSTGMRISEIVSANVSDLDLSNNRLVTIGKGNKEREILFSDKTKFYLERYLSNRKDNKDALFISLKEPHERVGTRALQKRVRKIKSKSNVLAKVTPHVFRHSMATHMISGGADLTTVQHLLGHENINTTQIYAEVSTDKVKYQHKQCLNI